jgi:hypothetical protein
MAFLTVDGTPIPVQSSNAVQREDHRQGSIRYAHNGGLLCSLHSPKREWAFTTRPLTDAEEVVIRGVLEGINPYAQRTVSGTGIGSTISAVVLIGEQPYIQDGLSHQRILEISILEV